MKFNLLALTVLSAFVAEKSIATTPPSPVWHEITLTDGSSSEAILRGSADFHWFEDKQGNALIQQSGTWFFAQIQSDSTSPELVSTGIAKTQVSVAPELAKFRPELVVKPSFSSLQTIEPMARKKLLRSGLSYQAMSGSGVTQQPLLVVQVSFTDEMMTHDFEQRVFGQNGQSVVDYFEQNSKGQYKVVPAIESYGTENDGVIDVTVPLSHPDCHSSDSQSLCDEKINKVFAEAYQKLDPYLDLSHYDSDQNGAIDATELSVMFVFAGGDRSTGDLSKPAIWPHKYSHDEVSLDGKTISEYCVFADFQEQHQSTLGVIVHELGHLMLGLPDLYSRYSDASIGSWGLMSYGSWAMKAGDSYPGETPVNMSAWSRHAAGFVLPTVAQQSSTSHTLENDEVTLVYLDPYLKEYGPRIYLENRTFSDYDRALPAEGVLAMSVNILNRFNDVGNMQVQVMQADGYGELEMGYQSDQGDLYPNGGALISDTSYPGLSTVTGFNTDVTISDISSSESGGSFRLTKPRDTNKSAWFNSFYQEYVYSGGDDVLAVPLDLDRDTQLDGLQLYAQKTTYLSEMTYKVWRFPYTGSNDFTLVLNENSGELLYQGAFRQSSRVLFPQPVQLTAGQHLLVVEIEGGEFEVSFNFGSFLDTELDSQPVMWVGNSSEIYSSGLVKSGFSSVAFAALLNNENNSIAEARSDTFRVTKNTPLTLNLMDNDLVASGYQFEVDIVQPPVNGTISDNQYQPDTDFTGSDSFQYRLVSADGSLSSSAVSVFIEVVENNHAPVAVIDVVGTELKVGNRVTLSATNSNDPDGDVLSYQWQQVAGRTVSLGSSTEVNANFTIPEGAKAGDVLTFQLTVSDWSTEVSHASVDVEVQNNVPTATADSVTVAVSESIVIHVVANDEDLNGDNLEVQSVINVSGIGAANVENGKVVYQAPDSAIDNVKLEYVIADDQGAIAIGEVTVNVAATSAKKGSSSDGGGSFSYWSLMLLAFLGWRRRH